VMVWLFQSSSVDTFKSELLLYFRKYFTYLLCISLTVRDINVAASGRGGDGADIIPDE
jgi:hypothetical protein